jgi:hypothetical protein
VLGSSEGSGESVGAGDAGAIVEAAGELVGDAWGGDDAVVDGDGCLAPDPHADRARAIATSTARLSVIPASRRTATTYLGRFKPGERNGGARSAD